MAYYHYQGPDGSSPKDKRPDNGSNKDDNNKNDVGYWIMAGVFLLIGAWPVSLIMLIVKLSNDRKLDRTYSKVHDKFERWSTAQSTTAQNTNSAEADRARAEKQAVHRAGDTVLRQPKKGGKALSIIGIILALIGALLLFEPLRDIMAYGYYSYMLDNLLQAAGFILCGGCMWIAGGRLRRRNNRRLQYLNAMQGQRLIMIKALASIAGVTKRTVCRDLQDMIADGALPAGAYLDLSAQCLVLDPAAMPYTQQAQAVENAAAEAAKPAPAKTEGKSEYETILEEIRQCNVDIKDETMSAKIDRIETITRSIFSILEEKPERRQEIRSFFSYYLPTTKKLLSFYAQLEAQPVQSQTILDSRHNIEGIMDNLVKGFENQLDSLFKADALDISSDISVLENMLAQDGLSEASQKIAELSRKSTAQSGTSGAASAAAPDTGTTVPSLSLGGTAAAVLPEQH